MWHTQKYNNFSSFRTRSGRWPRMFFIIFGTYRNQTFIDFSPAQGIQLMIFLCHTVTHGTDLRRFPLTLYSQPQWLWYLHVPKHQKAIVVAGHKPVVNINISDLWTFKLCTWGPFYVWSNSCRHLVASKERQRTLFSSRSSLRQAPVWGSGFCPSKMFFIIKSCCWRIFPHPHGHP